MILPDLKNDIINSENSDFPVYEFSRLIELLKHFRKHIKITEYEFIKDTIRGRYLEKDELINLLTLVDIYKIDDDELNEMLEEEINNIISYELEEIKNDVDISDYYYEDEGGINFQEEGVRDEIIDSLDSLVLEFRSSLFNKLGINSNYLIQDVDVDEMLNGFLESRQEGLLEDYHSTNYSTINTMDQIDDLFDRS